MFFSCIIPAYNEGPRIAAVIQAVLDCTEINEVIIVDDGSMDNTWEAINTFEAPKLRKIKLEKNQGKTIAFFIGLHDSKGTHIMMLDADYSGFTREHAKKLIQPIQENAIDSTMMMWKESLFVCKLLKHDMFSGTRVLPRFIFQNEKYFLSGKGFSLETKINETLYLNNVSVKSFYFPDVHNPSKGWKQILWKQPRDILSVMPLWKILRQSWYLYKQQP